MDLFDTDPGEHPECRYCQGFLSPNAVEKDALWNRPILQSSNFVVIPTLGHFIPGWLLIVSRVHVPCVGALDLTVFDELCAVKTKCESLLAALYGQSISFEHGSCSYGPSATCVEHAHIHVVPTNEDLTEVLAQHFSGCRVHKFEELTVMFAQKRSYLMYEDAHGVKTVFDTPIVPSQYLRMLLASRVGRLEKYDWREYSGESELRDFMSRLNNLSRRAEHEAVSTT